MSVESDAKDFPFTRNMYRVPPRQWRKWSIVARGTFNKTFTTLRKDIDLYRPKPAAPVSKKDNTTMAWNCAWLAADCADATLKDIAEG